MDDFCEDIGDVIGKTVRANEQGTIYRKMSPYRKVIDGNKLLFKLYKKYCKNKLYKRLHFIRNKTAPIIIAARKYDKWCKLWWKYATTPSREVKDLKIPGRALNDILGRINEPRKIGKTKLEKWNYRDQFFFVYRYVKDELERWYPEYYKLFTFDLHEKPIITDDDYEMFLKYKVYPVLRKKLDELRGHTEYELRKMLGILVF